MLVARGVRPGAGDGVARGPRGVGALSGVVPHGVAASAPGDPVLKIDGNRPTRQEARTDSGSRRRASSSDASRASRRAAIRPRPTCQWDAGRDLGSH